MTIRTEIQSIHASIKDPKERIEAIIRLLDGNYTTIGCDEHIDCCKGIEKMYPTPGKMDNPTLYKDGTKITGSWANRLEEYYRLNLHRIPK